MHRLVALVLVSAFVTFGTAARAGTFGVDSSAFWNGGAIPPFDSAASDGCRGRNVSPPLRLSGLPGATRSLGIIVFDTDANAGAGFVHWVAYGIAPRTTIPSGFGTSAAGEAYARGRNDAGTDGYFGPCPPPGDPAHHYSFTVYATTLAPGRLPNGLTRAAYLQAIAGHTIAAGSIVGTFAR